MKKSGIENKTFMVLAGCSIFMIGVGIGISIHTTFFSKDSIPSSIGISNSGNKAENLPLASYSLATIINPNKSPPFACSFGTYTVEMVDSKYTDHKYFKVQGRGMLINSGYIHTNVGSHPDIIYAAPKDSAITNGATLSGFCISNLVSVPYEGKERAAIDQSAPIMSFYLLN